MSSYKIHISSLMAHDTTEGKPALLFNESGYRFFRKVRTSHCHPRAFISMNRTRTQFQFVENQSSNVTREFTTSIWINHDFIVQKNGMNEPDSESSATQWCTNH